MQKYFPSSYSVYPIRYFLKHLTWGNLFKQAESHDITERLIDKFQEPIKWVKPQ